MTEIAAQFTELYRIFWRQDSVVSLPVTGLENGVRAVIVTQVLPLRPLTYERRSPN
jgi:hypothetical protein